MCATGQSPPVATGGLGRAAVASLHTAPFRGTSDARNKYCHSHKAEPLVATLASCLGAILIAYLLVVLAAMFFENSLIFFPSRYPDGDWRPAGPQVRGRLVPGRRWHAAARLVRAVSGGPGGGALLPRQRRQHHPSRRHPRNAARQVGVSVLIFDYRGYGRSEGKPTEAGILADARAARAWLAGREKIAQRDVVLMGESIGGAVAVDLAARDGARALVLESTFDTLPDVAAYHFPWLPVRWAMRTRLDSAAVIGQYHGPLLQSHGDADYDCAVASSAAACSRPPTSRSSFCSLPGHDHNDPMPTRVLQSPAGVLGQSQRDVARMAM